MSAILITYDLNREVTRPPIVKKIRELGSSSTRLSESSYAVTGAGTVEQIHAALKPLLDANDHIYIITLKKPYTGFGPKDTNDWLERNLDY